ncbi:MAG: ATP-binding protein [Vicinamibacterales bacterium]
MGSLQSRLLLAVGVLALAAVVAVALAVRQGTRVEFRKFQELERQRASGQIGLDLEPIAATLRDGCCPDAALARAGALLRGDQALLVVDPEGTLVASTGPGTSALADIQTRVRGQDLIVEAVRRRGSTAERIALQFLGGPAFTVRLTDGRDAIAHVVPIPPADGLEPGVAFLGSVDRRLLAATALVGLLALAVTWLVTRRIVQPLAELRVATRAFAEGDLTRRIDASGTDEVAELAGSFNRMAAALEHQQRLRRDLVHDVAHELRTPLTALRCRLETVADGLATDPARTIAGASEEVRHLSRLVDDLQELALAEAGELTLTLASVPVAGVLRSALRASGLDDDPRVQLEVAPTIVVRTDALRLRQILINLLTNADRYTPPDGAIRVTAAHASGQVVVSVGNTGSSLDPEQVSRVFDRFYRADPARQRATGGSGLGLAIVRHLAEALGGSVDAHSDATSVTMRVRLPE